MENEMPEETNRPAILGSIQSVMDAVRSIEKQGSMRVGSESYSYRRAEDVMEALGDAFRENAVMLQSTVVDCHHGAEYEVTKTTQYGDKVTHWHRTIITMRYRFTSLLDGSTLDAEGVGEGMDAGDKSASKAMTAAMKYALTQALQIAFKGIHDPDDERPELDGERETDAQRVLRERREAQAGPEQAAPVAPTQEPVSATPAQTVTEPQQQTRDPQPAAGPTTSQPTAPAATQVADPMTNGVQALKDGLGAREIDTPEHRDEQAEKCLEACSNTLAKLVREGGEWTAATPEEIEAMRKAVAAADRGDLDKVNKIIIHADKIGLLTRPFGESMSLGKKLWQIRAMRKQPVGASQ